VNNSMITATASMSALQQKLDMLADNIANINTDGYKRKTSVFEDLLTSMQPHEKAFEQPGRRTPAGFTQGWGVRLSSMQLDMTQGTLKATGNPNDVAIEGNALFEVATPDGSPAFTRQGAFQLVPLPNGERQLVTDGGLPILAQDGSDIIVPEGRNLVIAADGKMQAVGAPGSTPVELGKLRLVQVVKPELLRSIGDNLYGIDAGTNTGDVVQLLGVLPMGTAVRQGFSEQSNVSLTDEMAELMTVQRAYQMSSRALTSSEQMLSMANNLRA
jgi:flagellar basal-body rod protein FlgG